MATTCQHEYAPFMESRGTGFAHLVKEQVTADRVIGARQAVVIRTVVAVHTRTERETLEYPQHMPAGLSMAFPILPQLPKASEREQRAFLESHGILLLCLGASFFPW